MVKESSICSTLGMVAVSYTHLDVYKRQVMECDSLSVTVDGESMVLPQKEFMLLYKMASFLSLIHI